MYVPTHFVENNSETLHALIRAHPLGLLISAGESGIEANPIPFLLYVDNSGKIKLRAHLARANPQIDHLSQNPQVLIVFQGDNAYVTPSWYQSKKEHGKVVPTWDYVMVQVRGRVSIMDDPAWLQDQISSLTRFHEQGRKDPWEVADAPDAFIEMQKRGIVGIEIEVEDMRGKWKVSQNRPAGDQAGVVAGYEASGNHAMAALVRERQRP